MPVDPDHVDTILIDGTDLATTGRIVQQWEGVHTTPASRGSGQTLDGRDGVLDDTDRPFEPGILSLGLMLRGSSDVTGFNDAYRTLKRLVKPGSKVTLTRRLSFTTGNEDHTAQARYVSGLEPTMVTPADGKMVLIFSILDGLWYGPAATFTVASSGMEPHSLAGDVRTRRMTITLSGSGTSTNLVGPAGSLHYEGSKSTPVIIDVEAMTATQGGVDVSANLTWTGAFPFTLQAGYQLLLLSTGSASITYQPAYL